MRKVILLVLGSFVLASMLPAASITWYSDRAAWQTALDATMHIQTTATFDGVAPVNGYVQPALPFSNGGITFTHENATTPYFIVVDSGYPSGAPGGNYNIGSGPVAQFGNTGYSGAGSYGRVSYANMFAGGLDIYTVVGSSAPNVADVTIRLATSDSQVITTPGTVGGAQFVGFISDTAMSFFDVFAALDRE